MYALYDRLWLLNLFDFDNSCKTWTGEIGILFRLRWTIANKLCGDYLVWLVCGSAYVLVGEGGAISTYEVEPMQGTSGHSSTLALALLPLERCNDAHVSRLKNFTHDTCNLRVDSTLKSMPNTRGLTENIICCTCSCHTHATSIKSNH